MKVFLPLLLFLLLRFDVVAQDKHTFVYEVFNNMYNTMSQGQEIKPNLRISQDKNTIADFDPIKNELIIGSDFIKLCRSFGKDSNNVVSYILGHELAHILLQQNDITAQLGSSFASSDYSKQLKRIKKTLRDTIHERQADEFANFYAHIAGYQTAELGSVILDSIYTQFNLKDTELRSYPTLNERKKISLQASLRMETLKQVFDLANYASLMGNYSVAQHGYETILKEKFISSEIYNNLAVSHLNQALKDIDTTQFPYSFPFELDFSSRLYTTERSFETEYEAHLKTAIKYCDLVLGKNQGYQKAWINKSLAYFLLSEKLDAFYCIEKAQKLNDSCNNKSLAWTKAIYQIVTSTNEKEKLIAIENYNHIVSTSSFDSYNIEALDTVQLPNYSGKELVLKKSNFVYTNNIQFKIFTNSIWKVVEMKNEYSNKLTAFSLVSLPHIDAKVITKSAHIQLNQTDFLCKYKNWILLFSDSELKKCIFISI
jgi:tetratricopeptide (TPR) repeat protein